MDNKLTISFDPQVLDLSDIKISRKDKIYGTDKDDFIVGGIGNNLIFGGAGHDVIVGDDCFASFIANDTLVGGTGDDMYYVNSSKDIIIEGMDEGIDTVYPDIDYTLGDNLENLILMETKNIDGIGNELNNFIMGNSGNNILDGKAGDDIMIGFEGNDTYYIDSEKDRVIEYKNDGIDAIYSTLSYTLGENIEKLVLAGEDNLAGQGNERDNILTGNWGDNLLNGKAGDNKLYGGYGNDTLIGESGHDSLYGGNGDDIYIVNNHSDYISESRDQGYDTVYSADTFRLRSNIEDLILTGIAGINGYGNNLSNNIAGNDEDNCLFGYDGEDTIVGGKGSDKLDGGDDNDYLSDNIGDDILIGGSGIDTLIGGDGNDSYYIDNKEDLILERENNGIDTVYSTISFTLNSSLENLTLSGKSNINGIGNDLDNIIRSNNSNNILDGGQGNDTLYGGGGSDTYVFNTGDGMDAICDYYSGGGNSDKILFGDGIAKEDIAFFVQGVDLVIKHSNIDQITILGQTNLKYTVEKIQLSDNYFLSKSDINHIIQDIASYNTENTSITITNINTVKSDMILMNIISEHWHT